MPSPWKWLAAFRVVFELVGVGVVVSAAAFWVFPGAWHGLGLSNAARLAVETAGPASVPALIAPADMVSILLTVVTIVLAVVAFLVSIAAFLGISAIRDIAAKTASERAEQLAASVESSTKEALAKVAEAASSLEQRFADLQSSLREELAQSKGLSSGQDADAFAQAATGVESHERL